jgi:hypothetical protein
MTRNVLHAVAVALLAAAAPAARAHEFACDFGIGVVDAASGLPSPSAGLPVFGTAPAPVLTLQSYPALVGFRITLTNLATAPSVVTGVSNELLAGPAPAFGAAIAPGFSLDVGASATMVRVVAVASQEQCLQLFGAISPGVPACNGFADDRFVVQHDAGSVECTARIVCGAPQGPPPPPPPTTAGCASVWGGPRQLDLALPAYWYARPEGIALDASCNASVTGSAVDLGAITPPAVADAFLARLDAAGNTDENVRFGTLAEDRGVAVAATPAGDRFVAWEAGISRTPGIPTVSRFAPDGTEIWRRSATDTLPAGVGGDSGSVAGIGLDAAGNPVVVGYRAFSDTIWATKLDAASGAVIWSRFPSDALAAFARDAAVDGAGNVIFCGATGATPLPGNTGLGFDDAFVAKLGPDGDLLWARQFGSAGSDQASGCAVDAAGDAYVVGYAAGSPFLAKYEPAGAQVWMQAIAASEVRGVAVDPAGDAWVVGTGAAGLGYVGQFPFPDAFVARYDAAGARVWATLLGTPGFDAGIDVAIDALGNSYALTTESGANGPPAATIVYKVGPDGTVQ